MTKDKIISGLKMTMELFLFDPSTGETCEPDDLNELNRTTYDACKGAVELLENLEPHWIPVTKDLPKESGHYIVTTRTVCLPINLLHPELNRYSNNVRIDYFCAYDNKFDLPSTVAWWSEPLPEPYKEVTE